MIKQLLLRLAVGATFAVALAPASPAAASTRSSALGTTVVNVVAGKPSEFRFTLSRKVVPAGRVLFKITNAGAIPHDFQIAGHRTPTIAPHHAATLVVTFAKGGNFAYLCTIAGHAAAGMKGTLRVAAATPARTAVVVTAGKPSEFRFALSRRVVPAGTVIFKVTNRGKLGHDFKLGAKKTRILAPGQTQTIVLALTRPGVYHYLCTVAGHAAAGMKGVLTVR